MHSSTEKIHFSASKNYAVSFLMIYRSTGAHECILKVPAICSETRVYQLMKSLEQQEHQQIQTTTKFPERIIIYFPWSDIGELKQLLSFNVNLLVSHSPSLSSSTCILALIIHTLLHLLRRQRKHIYKQKHRQKTFGTIDHGAETMISGAHT